MKKWSYLLIAGAILTGSSIYTHVSSDTGKEINNAVETSPENSLLSSWQINKNNFVKPAKKELKQRLSQLQYEVTQNDGTERPFSNDYWDNKNEGIYVDVISGEPLFSSTDKYKSGTGWPSFIRPIKSGALTKKADRKFFYTRTELRSRIADSHLGHLFEDGPKPTGLRYCINSASMRFVPKEELASRGYEEFVSLFEK